MEKSIYRVSNLPEPPTSKMIEENGKDRTYISEEYSVCGCGNLAEYQTSDFKWACNKYTRCPSYNELVKANDELFSDMSALLDATKGLIMFREGTENYENYLAEIKHISSKNGFDMGI